MRLSTILAFILISGAMYGILYGLGVQMPPMVRLDNNEMIFISLMFGLVGAIGWVIFVPAKEEEKPPVLQKEPEIQVESKAEENVESQVPEVTQEATETTAAEPEITSEPGKVS